MRLKHDNLFTALVCKGDIYSLVVSSISCCRFERVILFDIEEVDREPSCECSIAGDLASCGEFINRLQNIVEFV